MHLHCGKDTSPGGKGYANLMTAIRHCEKHFGIRWQRQCGGGYIKCLNANEKMNVVHQGGRHIAKVARRNCVTLENIKPEELNGGAAEWGPTYAQHRMLAVAASNKTQKALKDHGVTKPPDMPQLLEMFAKAK